MLLTIHNLPSHIRYSDLKSLLQAKCGLTQLILDNLVNEGNFKKVTVGLAEEEDAALLVRKINGIYLEGHQLYVEDMRQKKPSSEQPYRPIQQQNESPSTNTFNNPVAMAQNQDYSAQNFPQMGTQFPNCFNMNPPMMTQDQMAMMSQPMMNNMYMYQNPYCQDPQQMQFLQQQQMQQSQQPKLQEPPSQQLRLQEPPSQRPRLQEPPSQQLRLQEPPSQRPRLQEPPSQQPRAPYDKPYNERTNARAPNQDANVPYYQMNQSSHSPQRDQRTENPRNRPSNWQNNNNNRNRSRSPHGYDRERGVMSSDRYQNAAENSENDKYGRANAPRTSTDVYSRRNSSPMRNPNSHESYGYRQESKGKNYVSFSTDKPQNRDPTSLTDYPQGWGPSSSTDKPQNRGPRPSTDKPQGWRPRSSTDTAQTWRSNAPTNNTRREQANKSNKPYEHPPSLYRWDRNSATNSQQSNRPRAPAPTESHGNKNVQRTDQFQNKPRPEVNKNQPAPSNIKQQIPEPSKANKGSYEKLLQKDETWKQQAAAFLQKEISQTGECPTSWEVKFVKTLRKAVLTRIELVLQEQIGIPMVEVVNRYRRTFPPSEDPTFFKAVMKTFKEKMEKELNEPGSTKLAQSDKKELKTESKGNVNVDGKGNENVVAKGASGSAATQNKPTVTPNTNQQNHRKLQLLNLPKGCDKPPKPGRLPKYLQSNKQNYKDVRKAQKEEFENEDFYQLEPTLSGALNDEVAKLCDIIKAELKTAQDPDEKIICDGLAIGAVDMFRKSLKINISKRILNIRTNLVVRVFAHGKPPHQDAVHECLKELGVACVKKSISKQLFYTATCYTYDDYDRLLLTGSIPINEETTLIFKPFQLIGPPKKLKKNQKNQQLKDLMNEQSYENFDDVAESADAGDVEEDIADPYIEEEQCKEEKDDEVLDNVNDEWKADDFEDW